MTRISNIVLLLLELYLTSSIENVFHIEQEWVGSGIMAGQTLNILVTRTLDIHITFICDRYRRGFISTVNGLLNCLWELWGGG
jgi:hypothetical protein